MTDRWTASRIVSLLPSATEIVYALGLAERLVGVTHECDFPPQARAKARLTASELPPGLGAAEIDRHVRASVHAGSSLYALDGARLERLAPDLIVTQELCAVCAVSYDIVARAAKRLRGDPRIVSLEPASLEDVFANIVSLGEWTGTSAEAAELVRALRERLAVLRAQVAGRARPRTLLLEWTQPPFCAGHWTPGLIDAAGGEAVLARPGSNSKQLAWEAIAEADPDVVIVVPCGYGIDATLQAVAELDAVPEWRALRALRTGRAYALDGNAYVNRPGPRLVDSAEFIASALWDAPFGAARAGAAALRRIPAAGFVR